jgi:hypothetical protein
MISAVYMLSGIGGMNIRSAVCCAVMMAFATCAGGATKPSKDKAVKARPKAAQKPVLAPRGTGAKASRASVTKTAAKRATFPLRGKTETLTCRNGTEDRHARIGVVLVGGRIDSFAYYSKWKPRTCSIYLQRNRDPYSRWVDKGSVTNVNLERGFFLIEHGKGEYRFVFRDVDRERYCGMDGTINGALTIRKGAERCELTGIMEEGVPLGQAYAHVEQKAISAAPAPVVQTAPRQVVQRTRRQDEGPWPTPTAGPGD